VEDWASEIIRPIRVTAQWPPGIAASVIRYSEPGSLLDGIRPPNMGFGVSYALPIIVAGLLAPEGGLFIVENPEAHLHPAGQSKIGRFLGRLAGSGVQVIVETHSDHVLNGIRLAAVDERTVGPSEVIVHYFDGAEPVSIEMTERGGLSKWPNGFFDQLENDLGGLARAQRR
jgi:predicted ATPase